MIKHEVATWNFRKHLGLCLKATGKPRKALWRWLIAELLRPLFLLFVYFNPYLTQNSPSALQ